MVSSVDKQELKLGVKHCPQIEYNWYKISLPLPVKINRMFQIIALVNKSK